MALYALQCTLRQIPSLVTEPLAGQMRLQWWRDVLDAMCAGNPVEGHPVIEELSLTGFATACFQTRIGACVDAHAAVLYGRQFGDAGALAAWFERKSAVFDDLAFVSCGAGDDRKIRQAVLDAGTAFGLVREGSLYAPELADAITARALEDFDRAVQGLKAVSFHALPSVLHLCLVRPYARRAGRPFPVMKRLYLLRTMCAGW